MDSWEKLIQMAEETTRCAKLAEDNLKAAAYYWRLKHGQEENCGAVRQETVQNMQKPDKVSSSNAGSLLSEMRGRTQ